MITTVYLCLSDCWSAIKIAQKILTQFSLYFQQRRGVVHYKDAPNCEHFSDSGKLTSQYPVKYVPKDTN